MMRTETKTQVNIGKTNLMAACEQGRTLDVKIILQKKPLLVASKDRNGKTALHYSAEAGSLPCVQLLVSADSTLVNAQDGEGFTPLHIAVITGHRTIVKFLLKHGADPNAIDKERHSCVHWASVCGDVETLDILLNNGADPSTADILGAYPIHYAAQMCGPQSVVANDTRIGIGILRKLIRRGASIQCRDRDGREPLLWAASTGSCEAVLLLFSSGANIMASDKDGLTALHCAASRGHTSTVETLVTLCGAKVNGGDALGCSPLFYSAAQGHADATHTLLKYGADPNLQDSKGRTAAHCAAGKGQWETMRILDSNGADLWIRNTRGNLPLHEAGQSGRKDLVQWLLQQNPRAVNATNMNGRTPLHITAQNNNVEMCEVLIEHGAFINSLMVNVKGFFMTPLDVAVHQGNQRCAKFIHLHGGIPATKVLENTEIDRSLLFSLGNYACSHKDRSDEDGISMSSFENLPRPAPTVTITKNHKEPLRTTDPATTEVAMTPSESLLTNVTSEEPADASVHIHLTTDDLWTMWESLMQGFATETASGDVSGTSPIRNKMADDSDRLQPVVTSVYLKKINNVTNGSECPDGRTRELSVRMNDRSGASMIEKKEVAEYVVANIVGSREREGSRDDWLQKESQRLEKVDAEERCTCSSHVSGMDSDSRIIDRRRRNVRKDVDMSDSVGSDTEDIRESQAPKLIRLRKKKSDTRTGGRMLEESETSSGNKPEERVRYPYLKRAHRKHPPKVNDHYVRLPELEDHIEKPKEEEMQQLQGTDKIPEIQQKVKHKDQSAIKTSDNLAPITARETKSQKSGDKQLSFPNVRKDEDELNLPMKREREEEEGKMPKHKKGTRKKSVPDKYEDGDGEPTERRKKSDSREHLHVPNEAAGKSSQYSSDASAMETDVTCQDSTQTARDGHHACHHFHHHHHHHHHHLHDIESSRRDSLRTISPILRENLDHFDEHHRYQRHRHRKRSKYGRGKGSSSFHGRTKHVSDGEFLLQRNESEHAPLLRSKSEVSIYHRSSYDDLLSDKYKQRAVFLETKESDEDEILNEEAKLSEEKDTLPKLKDKQPKGKDKPLFADDNDTSIKQKVKEPRKDKSELSQATSESTSKFKLEKEDVSVSDSCPKKVIESEKKMSDAEKPLLLQESCQILDNSKRSVSEKTEKVFPEKKLNKRPENEKDTINGEPEVRTMKDASQTKTEEESGFVDKGPIIIIEECSKENESDTTDNNDSEKVKGPSKPREKVAKDEPAVIGSTFQKTTLPDSDDEDSITSKPQLESDEEEDKRTELNTTVKKTAHVEDEELPMASASVHEREDKLLEELPVRSDDKIEESDETQPTEEVVSIDKDKRVKKSEEVTVEVGDLEEDKYNKDEDEQPYQSGFTTEEKQIKENAETCIIEHDTSEKSMIIEESEETQSIENKSEIQDEFVVRDETQKSKDSSLKKTTEEIPTSLISAAKDIQDKDKERSHKEREEQIKKSNKQKEAEPAMVEMKSELSRDEMQMHADEVTSDSVKKEYHDDKKSPKTEKQDDVAGSECTKESGTIKDSEAEKTSSEISDRMVREKTFITKKYHSDKHPSSSVKELLNGRNNERRLSEETSHKEVAKKTEERKKKEEKHATISRTTKNEKDSKIGGETKPKYGYAAETSDTTKLQQRNVGTQVFEKQRIIDTKTSRFKPERVKPHKSEAFSPKKPSLQVHFLESSSRRSKTRESYAQTKFHSEKHPVTHEEFLQAERRKSMKSRSRESIQPKPIVKLPKTIQGRLSRRSELLENIDVMPKESSVGTQTEKIIRSKHKLKSKDQEILEAKLRVESNEPLIEEQEDQDQQQKVKKGNLGAIFFVDKDSEGEEDDKGTPRMHPRKSDNPFENYEFHKLNEKGELTLFCSSMNGNPQSQASSMKSKPSHTSHAVSARKPRQPQSNLEKPGFLWVHFGPNSSPIHTLKKKPSLSSESKLNAKFSPTKHPRATSKLSTKASPQKCKTPIRKAKPIPSAKESKELSKPSTRIFKKGVTTKSSLQSTDRMKKEKDSKTSPQKLPKKSSLEIQKSPVKKGEISTDRKTETKKERTQEKLIKESSQLPSIDTSKEIKIEENASDEKTKLPEDRDHESLTHLKNDSAENESLIATPSKINTETNGMINENAIEIIDPREMQEEEEESLPSKAKETLKNLQHVTSAKEMSKEVKSTEEHSIESSCKANGKQDDTDGYREDLKDDFEELNRLQQREESIEEKESHTAEKNLGLLQEDINDYENAVDIDNENSLDPSQFISVKPSDEMVDAGDEKRVADHENNQRSSRSSRPPKSSTDRPSKSSDDFRSTRRGSFRQRNRPEKTPSRDNSKERDRDDTNQSTAGSTKSTSTEEGDLKLVIERKSDPEFSIKIKVTDPHKRDKTKADHHFSESDIASLKDSSGYVSAVESIYNNRRNFTIDVGHTTAKINTKLKKYDHGTTDHSSGALDVTSDSSPTRKSTKIPPISQNLVAEITDVRHHPLYSGRTDRELTVVNLARMEYFQSPYPTEVKIKEERLSMEIETRRDVSDSSKLPVIELSEPNKHLSVTSDPTRRGSAIRSVNNTETKPPKSALSPNDESTGRTRRLSVTSDRIPTRRGSVSKPADEMETKPLKSALSPKGGSPEKTRRLSVTSDRIPTRRGSVSKPADEMETKPPKSALSPKGESPEKTRRLSVTSDRIPTRRGSVSKPVDELETKPSKSALSPEVESPEMTRRLSVTSDPTSSRRGSVIEPDDNTEIKVDSPETIRRLSIHSGRIPARRGSVSKPTDDPENKPPKSALSSNDGSSETTKRLSVTSGRIPARRGSVMKSAKVETRPPKSALSPNAGTTENERLSASRRSQRKSSSIPIARTYSDTNLRSQSKSRLRAEASAAHSRSMSSLREEAMSDMTPPNLSPEVTVTAKTQHLASARTGGERKGSSRLPTILLSTTEDLDRVSTGGSISQESDRLPLMSPTESIVSARERRDKFEPSKLKLPLLQPPLRCRCVIHPHRFLDTRRTKSAIDGIANIHFLTEEELAAFENKEYRKRSRISHSCDKFERCDHPLKYKALRTQTLKRLRRGRGIRDSKNAITFHVDHDRERNTFKLPTDKLEDNKKLQVVFTIGKTPASSQENSKQS